MCVFYILWLIFLFFFEWLYSSSELREGALCALLFLTLLVQTSSAGALLLPFFARLSILAVSVPAPHLHLQRTVFGVCGVDASNQVKTRPGRLAGGHRGPHDEGAHGPQRLQVGRDGEVLHWTRWPGNQSCHHPEESCLHKLILIVLAVYLFGK